MKRWGWQPPSPALLIACVALFVALGGTVLAATKKIDGGTIRVKSLPGNRLKIGSVPGNRLHPGTIPGSSLAPGSVKGEQIDLGSLGQVPSAAHADSADTARSAQTAIAADQAADATTINGRSVGCRATARQFAGACWDLRPSTTTLTAPGAAAACANAGGELPSLLALLAFVEQTGVQPDFAGEWTSSVRVDSGGIYNVPILENGTTVALKAPEEPHHFRCVTPLIS
ncbi:MAG TPA: hypothetical protein VHV53_05495 [Solirubrobacterales bacterium]|jgi:hypothetical protein|nr:hypothetical protein [Solirubrobacterales bacterium]